MRLSDHILNYLFNLQFAPKLPENIRVMNPYADASADVLSTIEAFYNKYYADNGKRKLILGINPGRLGAGATGIPFTDSKRMAEDCGIDTLELKTHEPSSVFVYEVIKAMGGAEVFYKQFYISSVCPLGFIQLNKKQNWVNYNYYDDASFFKNIEDYLIAQLKIQLSWNIDTKNVFCLGTGKNYNALKSLNKKHQLFDQITPLEHPRYIMQYKSKQIEEYVDKFVIKLSK